MPFNGREWDSCRDWVSGEIARSGNNPQWELYRDLAEPGDQFADINARNAHLEMMLRSSRRMLGFPEITVNEWRQFIEEYQELWERRRENIGFVPNNNDQDQIRFQLPQTPGSCWVRYKYKLLERKHFPLETVEILEESCIRILNRFESDDGKKTQGMFLGNVQSGKTAHMAGLIAMAADCGFNFFIVLSGTIRNLREQTSERLIRDLSQIDGGNDPELAMTWHEKTFLNPRSPQGDRLQFLRLDPVIGGEINRNRYLTVCLKNSTWLKNLLGWLQTQNQAIQTGKLKILLIDDECDQASVNTGDIDENEATRIYSLIQGIVNHKRIIPLTNLEFTQGASYKAINYIAYSATPFGNLLNDAREESLYPFDYISTISPSISYWGSERIFGILDPQRNQNGTDEEEEFRNKPFLNRISIDDKRQIENLNDNYNTPVPQSFQKAIYWFICAGAIRRYWAENYPDRIPGTLPASMLIHTSNRVEHHENIGVAVIRCLTDLVHREDRLDLLREVYDVQKGKLPYENFEEFFPGAADDPVVLPYPEFDDLTRYLDEILRNGVQTIQTNEENEYEYGKGIHLCIDNSRPNQEIANQINEGEEEVILRIKYPQDPLNFVPLFIIVGGNTLARGLTLEGLVCSYFIRQVVQGDSLMQMGRWFGYRRGYETLPRIWVETETVLKFQFMTLLENHLRQQISDAENNNQTPRDLSPQIITATGILNRFNITSRNKQQAAIIANHALSGKTIQCTSLDIGSIEQNATWCRNFIDELGVFDRSVFGGVTAVYKEHVSWQEIQRFLENFQYLPGMIPCKNTIIEHAERHQELQGNTWTVIVPGRAAAPLPEEQRLQIGDNVIGIAMKTPSSQEGNRISFKNIRQATDFLADLDREQDIPEEYRNSNTSKTSEYRSHITTHRREHSLLVIKPLNVLDSQGDIMNYGHLFWSFAVYFRKNNNGNNEGLEALTVGNMEAQPEGEQN